LLIDIQPKPKWGVKNMQIFLIKLLRQGRSVTRISELVQKKLFYLLKNYQNARKIGIKIARERNMQEK
jgi:hypothetical protein